VPEAASSFEIDLYPGQFLLWRDLQAAPDIGAADLVRLETPCLVATLPMAMPDPIRPEYGARELKGTILRQLTQPLAAMVANGAIEPGSVVHADQPQMASGWRWWCNRTSPLRF
jgi:hypothetical protein